MGVTVTFRDGFKLHVVVLVTSSIYGSRSYVKWRYDGVRHGTSAGKCRDIAFGVLAFAL